MAAVSLEDVVYSRTDDRGTGAPVLGPVNLRVGYGECVLVGGASGAGKSTLLGVIAGLLPAWGGTATGSVLLDGRETRNLSVRDRAELVGYFPQDPAGQFLHRTVGESCSFTAENLGWAQNRTEAAVDVALGRLGVRPLADRNPQTLSGGERALAFLASLVVTGPRILLLDEPLANLDPRNAAVLARVLADLKRAGAALVLCEHREDLLGDLVDRRFVLGAGFLSVSGPRRPENPTATPVETPPTGEPLASFEDLAVSRGGRVLFRGLTLTVGQREIVAVRGANGAGKSSLLRVLAGLDAPAGGHRSVSGAVRLVGQDPLDQFCRATVHEEIGLDLAARRRRGRRRGSAQDPGAEDLLGQVGLAPARDRSPFFLSEGEKRRLTAVCGVLSGADLLLVDEPSAGLDPDCVRALAKVLRSAAGAGAGVVCVTHDDRLIRALGCRVVDLPDPEPAPVLGAADRSPKSPGHRWSEVDPRIGFLSFLTVVIVAVQPWPVEVSGGLLGTVVLSYPVFGWWRALGTFVRSLAVFWVVPGLILWGLAGPGAAVDGVVRLALLSFLFHRYALAVDGKVLAAALARWGIPYSLGFALDAALSLAPVLADRLRHIRDMLSLRLPRWQVVPAMLVPAVVHLWQSAVRLAMYLELRGFEGKAPGSPLVKNQKPN